MRGCTMSMFGCTMPMFGCTMLMFDCTMSMRGCTVSLRSCTVSMLECTVPMRGCTVLMLRGTGFGFARRVARNRWRARGSGLIGNGRRIGSIHRIDMIGRVLWTLAEATGARVACILGRFVTDDTGRPEIAIQLIHRSVRQRI